MQAITPELIRRFDVSGPRYTSYPTADRFVEAFGMDDYVRALEQRRQGPAAAALARPLSIYVHLPFCESLCYYCACNKIITKHHERAAPYLALLRREVELHVQHMGRGAAVSQLHLGGGTPTFLSDEELAWLMDLLRSHFTFQDGGEYSIEVDPRTVTAERLESLRRVQPAEQVFALVASARRIGFDSVNVDLIYGLPKQNPQSFARTLEQVCELRPDRIALYAYAHLPERFKPQRRIIMIDLPLPDAKVSMLASALKAFMQAGYVYIGMDHFALPEDALAIAKRQGRLHRNFQGYSTQPDCDLVGLGVSAIGKVGATYSQNVKTLDEYQYLIDQGRLPVARGLALSRDDILRRSVIMALMCQGEVVFESIELAHLIDFRQYFAAEMEQMREMQQQGLVSISDSSIQVTPLGWFFVRGVAMVFDKYLQADRTRARFSKII